MRPLVHLFGKSSPAKSSSFSSTATTDPKELYGYVPSEWLGIIAVILFGIIFALECLQGLVFLLWMLILPAIGTAGEIVGWAFRLKSSFDPTNHNAFIGQLVALIITPNFYSAQIYLIFEYFVKVYGHQYALLPARFFGIAFAVSDFVSLVIQGAGGGIAGGNAPHGASRGNPRAMNAGDDIMLAGIAFQQFSLGVFTFFCIQYAYCCWKDIPVRDVPDEQKQVIPSAISPKARVVSVIAEASALLWMTLRSIYRIVELADGWTGYVIHTEAYFGVFDFLFMVLCSASLLLAIEPFYTIQKLGSTNATENNVELTNQSK